MDSATRAIPHDVRTLRSAAAVRQRCAAVLTAAREGSLEHFVLDEARMPGVVDEVVRVTRANYPSLEIPLHSRMGHFGAQRVQALRSRVDPSRWPAAALDLVMVSVLLDAGAGPRWRFEDVATGQVLTRSEGLAVAGLRAFEQGLFSADPGDPLRVDAQALRAVDDHALGRAFSVRDDNPLVGVTGRVALLHGLADALEQAAWFPGRRPSGLLAALGGAGASVRADQVLEAVLHGLADIWPGRQSLQGHNLGDVWPHPAAGGEGATAGLLPLHKLSQWLTYSLVEPLGWGGLQISELDGLTGLAEYRNGGLFVDLGVLRPRDSAVLRVAQAPDGPVVIEWRALTVALLDVLAPAIRAALGRSAAQMPLGRVLEGGTWAAGRAVARARRADGSPPLRIASDGTLF